jgi:hypothetical protein
LIDTRLRSLVGQCCGLFVLTGRSHPVVSYQPTCQGNREIQSWPCTLQSRLSNLSHPRPLFLTLPIKLTTRLSSPRAMTTTLLSCTLHPYSDKLPDTVWFLLLARMYALSGIAWPSTSSKAMIVRITYSTLPPAGIDSDVFYRYDNGP